MAGSSAYRYKQLWWYNTGVSSPYQYFLLVNTTGSSTLFMGITLSFSGYMQLTHMHAHVHTHTHTHPLAHFKARSTFQMIDTKNSVL